MECRLESEEEKSSKIQNTEDREWFGKYRKNKENWWGNSLGKLKPDESANKT